MSVHPDMTALRAVDACGGIYTPAEEASGFAAGHRAALGSAMVSVGAVDGLMAEMLAALQSLSAVAEMTTFSDQYPLECEAARIAIANATGVPS